ncbi:MAG: rhomboid family intramembrane serine protease [Ignavibacteriae bacterium]|nr:rhomboid family intramembrane serine protease [Ignavibacteriota bacterium]
MAGNYQMRGFGGTVFTPVIKTLIIINVSVFLIQTLFGVFRIGEYSLGDLFFYYFALYPIGEHSNFFIWQLLSYQFLHGNIWHIFFNLLALWMFGIELEQMWGARKFIIFYLICGVGAGLVQLFISPMFAAPAPTIGASGSIYGILLAFGLTFPNRPIFMFPFFIPIPAKFFVLIYAGISLLMGFSSSGDSVAHFAHLGGAATGFLLLKIGDSIGLYRLFSKKPKQEAHGNIYNEESKVYKSNWFKREPEVKQEPQSKMVINGEEITQNKIDEILDKISASGYQNLTDREKHILFELSQKIK